MISVIVPVYNVEKYIDRCVSSLLSQTYDDCEILLVDDGSADRSGLICDTLAEQDQRIQVFHKENGGLSDARNYGLDRMKGEYVTFVDSDDYVGPDYLRILYEMIQKFGGDISVVRFREASWEDQRLAESDDFRTFLKTDRAMKEMLVGEQFGVSACGKMFRSTVFRDIRFPKGKLYEDLLTIPYVLASGDGCCFSTSRQYYYYQREGSIMHQLKDDSIEQWNRAIGQLYSFVEEKYPELNECVICRYLNFAFPTVINNLLNEKDYAERIRRFQAERKDWWQRGHENPYLSSMEKIRVYAVNKSPVLYRYLFQMNQLKKQAVKAVRRER